MKDNADILFNKILNFADIYAEYGKAIENPRDNVKIRILLPSYYYPLIEAKFAKYFKKEDGSIYTYCKEHDATGLWFPELGFLEIQEGLLDPTSINMYFYYKQELVKYTSTTYAISELNEK